MLLPAEEPCEQELIPERDHEAWKGRAAGVAGTCLLLGAAIFAIMGQRTSGSDRSLKHLRVGESTQLSALGQLSAMQMQEESRNLEDDKDNDDEEDELSEKSDWVPYDGWPCREGEEIFFGKCYASCANLTNGDFPYRNDDCTCCKSLPCVQDPALMLDDCGKFNKNSVGLTPMEPLLPDCPYANEELFEGLCYKKCALMTNGMFPYRSAMNTCGNGKYGGNWTMGLGPCSGFGIGGTKCAPHIPLAAGSGYEQVHDHDKHLPGRAPLGFTKLPDFTVPEKIMAQVPQSVQAATPMPLPIHTN